MRSRHLGCNILFPGDHEARSFETRLESLETLLETLETLLETLETRLETLETLLETLETRLESLEKCLPESRVCFLNPQDVNLGARFSYIVMSYSAFGVYYS